MSCSSDLTQTGRGGLRRTAEPLLHIATAIKAKGFGFGHEIDISPTSQQQQHKQAKKEDVRDFSGCIIFMCMHVLRW